MAEFTKKNAPISDVEELPLSFGVFDEQIVSFVCPVCGIRLNAYRNKNDLAKTRCFRCATEYKYQEKSRRHFIMDGFLKTAE